jgi:tetrahydromethanopterin S-methyltransferase subunit G
MERLDERLDVMDKRFEARFEAIEQRLGKVQRDMASLLVTVDAIKRMLEFERRAARRNRRRS